MADTAEPSPPVSEQTLAAKADDLEALRAAVVDAASVGAGLWLSYLAVLAYLTIAVGGVTHKDLFFQEPVKLPFLSVDLPLTSFFWLGPLLFLITHAYVLLHFVMLADKVSAFDTVLVDRISNEVQTKLRRQLPSNIFVQFLAGPTDLRDGLLGGLLWLIANVTLVIAPLLLLLFFELQFLPYHNAGITWLQRGVVGADLILIWTFWPAVALNVDASNTRNDRRRSRALMWRRRGTYAIMAVLSFCSVTILLLFATFPGEGLEKLRQLIPIPGREWLLREPGSFFSDRLVLSKVSVVDHAKLDPGKLNDKDYMDSLPDTASLIGRDLKDAILFQAVLRKANFAGADLEGANLDFADLRQANLGGSDLPEPQPQPAQNPETQPACTRVEGGTGLAASPQGACLNGASLNQASLQGATLNGAWLQGATLSKAWLQGATLSKAWLQGARLDGAFLQGARLASASLQGALLDGASLQGAALDGALLQGASLQQAYLQGATLTGAWLQGARLDKARLEGATLEGASVWRAVGPDVSSDNVVLENVKTSINFAKCKDPAKSDCPWTHEDFEEFQAGLAQQVPNGPSRAAMLERLQALDPDDDRNATIRQQRENWPERSASAEDAEVARFRQLWTAGCEANGPYVITGLIERMGDDDHPLFSTDRHNPNPNRIELAKSFLQEPCKGGLSPAQITTLRKFAEPAWQSGIAAAPTTK